MPLDLVDKGAKWLAGKRAAALVRPVTYEVAGGATLQVDATIGRTVAESVDERGLVVRVESRDFIVARSALAQEPRRGDRIVESDGSTQWTHEVLPIPGRPAWEWADGSRTAYRCHTKLILTESVDA